MRDEIELWFWLMRNDRGQRRRSVCRFTAEAALKMDPEATRIEGTREVRRSIADDGRGWSNTSVIPWDGKKDGKPDPSPSGDAP